MKKCYGCKKILSLTNFYKAGSWWDGYMNVCKNCERLRYRERRVRNKKTFKSKNSSYYEKHKEEILEKRKLWYEKNKHKSSAHSAVKTALYRGDIVKKPCEVCGEDRSQAHHEDYSKKLDVVWLCAKHHRLREMGEI